MADYAHEQTDKELAELEKKIQEVYGQAYNEMNDTVTAYFQSFDAQDKVQQEKLKNGEITQNEYNSWRQTQIARGERYSSMAYSLAERYENADEVATAYINDATPSVYSLNRNYADYTIEQVGDGIDFNLWDEATVRRLIKDNPSLMPNYPEEKAIKRGFDLNYGLQQIYNSTMSGILQGKSLARIANDLMNRIDTMSRASAIRSARTAFTAAENGGRQDSYNEAAEMGLEMEKVWLATLDERTRESHRHADFQVVPYNEPFDVGGEKMMFPADAEHGASGWNIYNCRCTMFEKPKGMSMDDFERWARNPETGEKELVNGMSYDDWLKSKQGETAGETEKEEIKPRVKSDFLKSMENLADRGVIEYNQVQKLDHPLTEREIIDKISGGDKTTGSCASLSLAYAGNRCGYDVTDYRGGISCDLFALEGNWKHISKLNGLKSYEETGERELQTTLSVMNNAEYDKEYILVAGKHASVIKRTEDSGYKYLELQSKFPENDTWHPLTSDSLRSRFGVTKNIRYHYGEEVESWVTMIEVDSFKNCDDFQDILGYLNTETDKQKKGRSGGIK